MAALSETTSEKSLLRFRFKPSTAGIRPGSKSSPPNPSPLITACLQTKRFAFSKPQSAQPSNLMERYKLDPAAYAQEVLDVQWWAKQREIAEALIKYKRVFVRAGNGPGKSFLAAGLVNWFYDVHVPGRCLTTAPTQAQVQDVLWAEVRAQRRGRPGLQPKAARMEDAPDHFAVGYTASTAEAFQGRHAEHLMLVFDEGTGVAKPFWIAGEGMQPEYWLVLLNPTDTTSVAYDQEQSGRWHVICLDSFDHPNITEQMAGRPAPYPQASLNLSWLRERVAGWSTPIAREDVRSADFEFEGSCYRPGPLFESRVLGRWPTQGGMSVWSEAMWQAAQVRQPEPDEELQIGCDVARFGDDYTSIVARSVCAVARDAQRLGHHADGWAAEAACEGVCPEAQSGGGCAGR